MNVRPGARALALLFVCSAACGGPPTPSPIEGEPVCPDFEIGATRSAMRGSLRFPVTLTVLDGKDPVARATLHGRRTKDQPASRILLQDADAEYEVEWAQCENERAPRPLTLAHETRDTAEYACGNATVYKTDKLVTRKGDPASRTVRFAAPPKPACWESEVPPADPPPAPDAGADPAPSDAGAELSPSDAGSADAAAAASAAPASSAGAPPAAPAAPAGSAGAKPAASPAPAGSAGAKPAASPAPAGSAGAKPAAAAGAADAGAGGAGKPPQGN
ncbi:hypothetical protein WMF31_20985 [Sorangium sp. So ce1036]|uniref:hypothetical protein n=1 Tax=Sorangium sp. So ce1036 TaxID=3133328 RepID=UPI003F115108